MIDSIVIEFFKLVSIYQYTYKYIKYVNIFICKGIKINNLKINLEIKGDLRWLIIY